jgi:hypothetical protein
VTQSLVLCITCLNISSIVDPAHVVDLGPLVALLLLGGARCGVYQIVSVSEVHVVHYFKECSSALAGQVSTFFQHLRWRFCTAGNLITTLVFFNGTHGLEREMLRDKCSAFFGGLLVTVHSLSYNLHCLGKKPLEKQNCGDDWDDLFGVRASLISNPRHCHPGMALRTENTWTLPTVINGLGALAVVQPHFYRYGTSFGSTMKRH